MPTDRDRLGLERGAASVTRIELGYPVVLSRRSPTVWHVADVSDAPARPGVRSPWYASWPLRARALCGRNGVVVGLCSAVLRSRLVACPDCLSLAPPVLRDAPQGRRYLYRKRSGEALLRVGPGDPLANGKGLADGARDGMPGDPAALEVAARVRRLDPRELDLVADAKAGTSPAIGRGSSTSPGGAGHSADSTRKAGRSTPVGGR